MIDDDLRPSDTQKIHLTMKANFMPSKDRNENRFIHFKGDK